MQQQDQIKLNGLVRRTQNTAQLKQLIRDCGAKLSRKGRSRNWMLQADEQQIEQIIDGIYQKDESSWYWLVKVLAENRQKLSLDELLIMAQSDASLTVTQLMGMSDCTIEQARLVLDKAEFG